MLGAIIQARMSSTRLPGKVLHKVKGKPMIQYLLESLGQCILIDRVVVATSTDDSDGPVADFCREYGIACHRGPLEDVAKRFVEALDVFGLDAFVRICGDSPLLDYRLVDRAVEIFNSGQFDMVTNVLHRTFPKGQSVEVIDSKMFKQAYPLMREDSEREHISSPVYQPN